MHYRSLFALAISLTCGCSAHVNGLNFEATFTYGRRHATQTQTPSPLIQEQHTHSEVNIQPSQTPNNTAIQAPALKPKEPNPERATNTSYTYQTRPTMPLVLQQTLLRTTTLEETIANTQKQSVTTQQPEPKTTYAPLLLLAGITLGLYAIKTQYQEKPHKHI